MAALDRAVALAEVDPRAVAIEQDLDLDVARADDEVFEDEPVVVEGGRRLASGRGDRVGECLGATDRAHALAAAARRGLDEQGKADRPGRGDQGVVGCVGFVVAAEDRDAERRGEPSGRGLVAHHPDRLRRRADPADPGSEHGLREIGVLGQEPEARDGAHRRRRHEPQRRRRGCRAGRARPRLRSRARPRGCRACRTCAVMRVAISPRLAMNSVRIGVVGAGPTVATAPAATNASIASLATRQRPPTRLAGSRPLAIQRWTERVVAPIVRQPGSDSVPRTSMSRSSHIGRRGVGSTDRASRRDVASP